MCHRGGLDLPFCVDFEQMGHMTWELLSSNAHIYSIKYIKINIKYYMCSNSIKTGECHKCHKSDIYMKSL